MNQTSSRAAALAQVMRGAVRYDMRTGVYTVDGEPLSGAQRRTYAYLHMCRVIEPCSREAESVLQLTAQGEGLAGEWGLTSRKKVG